MGNQTQTVSRFSDRYLWLTIAKNNFKEIIQNKMSREIVEVHRVTEAEATELKGQNLVYEWRKDPKIITYIVQILEISHCFQEQNRNCIAVCQTSKKQTDLVVYTENLVKLYEMNSKNLLSEGQQIGIMKDIVQGIDVLAAKFGEFLPSKDAVGYNAKKRGKVWINDNFCLNSLQHKKTVDTKQQRQRWQREVIQTIIDICKLCTTQNNYKNNKFYFALQTIKKNKLNSFTALREFKGPERKPITQEKKQFTKVVHGINHIQSKRVEMANSQYVLSSNQFGAAQDPKQRAAMKDEIKYLNKTFDVPMSSHQNNKDSNVPYRTTYNQQNPQQIKFTPKQEKPKHRQNYSQIELQSSFLKPHYVELGKKKNTSYVVDNFVRQKGTNVKNQNYTKREVRQRPNFQALLEELESSHSSLSESRMKKRQKIQLVDSMQMVQKKNDYDSRHQNFHRYKHTVLQQSIILKSPYM